MDTNEMYRDRLKREAERDTFWRGHRMSPWTDCGLDKARAHCLGCGRGVFIDTHPLPNGIDIGGSAVAMGCI